MNNPQAKTMSVLFMICMLIVLFMEIILHRDPSVSGDVHIIMFIIAQCCSYMMFKLWHTPDVRLKDPL